MYEPNYLAEQQYIAAEREAEIQELLASPEFNQEQEPVQQPMKKGATA